MKNDWENDLIRKKDLIDWIQKLETTYKDLQYLYRDRIDYGKEMTILCAVADYIQYMNPDTRYHSDKKEEK